MKIELHVTYEVAQRSAATMIVEYNGETLGQVTLPFTERSDTITREGRDALAGVFLASLTAAFEAEKAKL